MPSEPSILWDDDIDDDADGEGTPDEWVCPEA